MGVNNARVEEVIRFCHGLADEGGLGENLRLACIRLEGLALLDSERLEHRQEKAVPLGHWLAVDNIREANPVIHSTGMGGQPRFAVRGDVAAGLRILAFGVRVDLNLFEQLHPFRTVCRHQADAEQDTVARGLEDLVSGGVGALGRFLSGTDEEILARLGDGCDLDLPHVVGCPANLPFRHDRDPWPVLQVDERQRIRGCRVVGQPALSVVIALKEDDLAVLRTELLLVGPSPLRHLYRWDRPEVGLARPLKVDFVEKLLLCFGGRIPVGEVVSETQVADTCLDGLLRMRVACLNGQDGKESSR